MAPKPIPLDGFVNLAMGRWRSGRLGVRPPYIERSGQPALHATTMIAQFEVEEMLLIRSQISEPVSWKRETAAIPLPEVESFA